MSAPSPPQGDPVPLREVPDDYPKRRDDAHRLAYAVVAEARRVATDRFGLRSTPGGFGTPPFGDDEQVRVADGQLVVRRGGIERRAPITTLTEAAAFVGVPLGDTAAEEDSPRLDDPDRPLAVDAALTAFLGSWFGFSFGVLEQLRTTDGAEDVSITQLWPGHFDAAIEMGSADEGRRATFGMSPGDEAHALPYAYVAAWGEVDRSDPFWADPAFNGASMSWDEIEASDDPHAAVLGFFVEGHRRLAG